MSAAQVVQPSVRRNRGTRGTRDTNTSTKEARRDSTKETIDNKRERTSRPSTRGVRETGGSGVQKPRRAASTRNQSGGPTAHPRASTRPISTRPGGDTVNKAESAKKREFSLDKPVSLLRDLSASLIKPPDKKSEAAPSDPRPRPSREQVYGQKREMARRAAPLHFVLAMFGVVVISMLAFGLLKGNPGEQHADRQNTANEEVIYQKQGTTSTNTGILRGN